MKIRDLTLCALFAALIAVCAWICVPLGGVVYTLQSFAVFLALLTLGGMRSTVAIWMYLCLGAVGLPVFSAFQGGFAALFGATGGYLWGFLLSALLYWLLTHVFGEKLRLPAVILGNLLCYVCGTCWMITFYGTWGLSPLSLAFPFYVLPYLLPDALKIWLACTLSKRLRKLV